MVCEPASSGAAADAALRYTERGWVPIPVPFAEKAPVLKGWTHLRLAESEIPRRFAGRKNIGIRLGEPSGGLTDADLDCPEALFLAPYLLPETAAIFGRKSKPASHRLYLCELVPRTQSFKDRDGTVLVEIRSTGAQTIFPPSVADGEVREWVTDEEPARISGPTLFERVAKLAAAALLARHWPEKGSRQDAALALAGGLLRGGWTETETNQFISAVSRATGDDEVAKRSQAGHYTKQRLAEGQSATGWSSLAELVGVNVAKQAREWLGGKRATEPDEAWAATALITLAPGELPELVDKAETVLLSRAEALGVFQRAGELVRVISLPQLKSNGGLKRPAGTVQLEPLSTVALTDIFGRIARWQRANADGRAHVVDCPPKIATIYRSRRGTWRLPILTGIVSAPILRGDGTVLSRAGYDAQTGLFLAASEFPQISDNPTRGDAQNALKELLEPFGEFPFVTDEDRSALAAAILTGVQRRLLGACPLFGFTAPSQRTGKSLLAEGVAIIATGKPVPAMAVSGEREEIRKAVASALREGHQIVNLDNVDHPLASPDLARAITQSEYADRALGENRLLRLPTNILWTATGNNLTFRGDLSSRVLLSRIDSGLERPEERNFKIPNLGEHLQVNRERLIAAALTILRAYHVAGRPSQEVIAWGGFEGWSRSIREPLVWLGLPDPCATRKDVVAGDPEREEAAAIFAAWHDGFKNKSATVKEAVELAKTDVGLHDALSAVALGHRDDKLDTRRIGHWLREWENTVVAGLQLSRDGESHRAIRWRVAKSPGRGPVSCASSGELSLATQSAPFSETGAEASDPASSRPEKLAKTHLTHREIEVASRRGPTLTQKIHRPKRFGGL